MTGWWLIASNTKMRDDEVFDFIAPVNDDCYTSFSWIPSILTVLLFSIVFIQIKKKILSML